MIGSSKVVTYVLDADGNPKPESDPWAWAHWMKSTDRRVGFEIVRGRLVSTSFDGLDVSRVPGRNPPLLWETEVYEMEGRRGRVHERRLATDEAARRYHEAVVEALRAGCTPDQLDGLGGMA